MLERIRNGLPTWPAWRGVLLAMLPLTALYAISRHHFLLFHCLTEAISIVIALAVFTVLWNTRHYLTNGYYLIIGLGCLFAAVLDLIYLFAYKGMGVMAFPGPDGNVALQAKLAVQWFVSLSCILAYLFFRRKINHYAALLLYSILLALSLATIFYWRVFPDCLTESGVVTSFERAGLLVSSGAYLAGIVLLIRRRRDFDASPFYILAAAGTAIFIQDFTSAVAVDPMGPVKVVAHLSQLVALYFVYQAFIEVGLKKPYDLLFRNLKQSEESLAHSAAELRKYATELEAKNDALEDLCRAAEVARKAKSEFLANMSHEIRTPMTAILGFADVLHGSLQRPEDLDCVQTIRRNGEYLLQLINDILDLSKLDVKKLVADRAACSPMAVVSDVVSLMRVQAKSKNLPLEVEYRGALPEYIQSDSLRLRQILINLVSNAVKFTELGSIRVVVCLLGGEDEPRQLRFDVIDTGIGITSQQAARLFEPFAQGDSSTTRCFGGTGLGLAISKRLAKILGGDLLFHSVPGKGSTFTFTVPTGPLDGIRLVVRDAVAATRPAANAPAAPRVSLRCRLLLAEDGQDNRRLLAFLLNRAGAEVITAENGQLALDRVHAARQAGAAYDLILMDMQMPVMDGYEATRRLRAEGCTIPIVALTAHAMAGDREKCLEAGCDDYLTKPVTAEALTTMVAKHVPRSAAQRPPTPKLLGAVAGVQR